MLKRLLGLGGAEAGGRGTRNGGKPGVDALGPSGQSDALNLDAVYAHAIKDGLDEEKAQVLGFAYADGIAQGKPSAYAIVYAAAYSIARSILGAHERWARAYAQACAHAIAAQESVRFASLYGHAVADGALPEDALVFARRYAA